MVNGEVFRPPPPVPASDEEFDPVLEALKYQMRIARGLLTRAIAGEAKAERRVLELRRVAEDRGLTPPATRAPNGH